MKIKRYMGLFDIHVGRQAVMGKTKMLYEDTHDERAINTVMEFALDWKPDYVILGGDQLNCGPVSHWHKGKPRLSPDLPLRWELERLDELCLRKFDAIIPASNAAGTGRGRKVWKRGNHENWIIDAVNESPGIAGLIEPECFLGLESRGWEIAGDTDIPSFGKIHFIHGHEILKKGNVLPGSGAKKVGLAYRRNIRFGHVHGYEVYTDVTPVDRTDYHTAIMVPPLAKPGQAYAGGSPASYQQGFIIGEILPDGNFNDFVIVMNEGKFVWNGRVYGK